MTQKERTTWMIEASSKLSVSKGGRVNRWLFNPFYYIAGGKALMIGIVVMLTTGLFANLGKARFNGLLDFRIGLPAQPWWLNVSEVLISWLIFSCLLLISGKFVSKSRVRAIDVFGTQALARTPYLFASLFALIPATHRFVQKMAINPTALQQVSLDMLIYISMAIFTILMMVWMVLLMYRAFSISCNAIGKSAVSVFIVSLIVGEILSLAVLHYGSRALQDRNSGLTARAESLVSLLSKEEYGRVEEMFDETMAAGLPAEKLATVWQSLIAQFGPFENQGAIRETNLMGYEVVYVPCRFERATLDCQLAFDGEGRISGLYFLPDPDD